MSAEHEYRCSCGTLLTPTEAAQHVAEVQAGDADMEEFQRNLAQYCLDPMEDDDAGVIPDTAPQDMATIAEANEEMHVPDWWRHPQCYACQRAEAFLEAVRNPDGWTAESVMWIAHKGLCGCGPNPLLAYTWAYAALTRWRGLDAALAAEHPDDPASDHTLAIQEVLTAASAHLSATERHRAENLAEEIFAIWRQYEDYYARLLTGGQPSEPPSPPRHLFPRPG